MVREDIIGGLKSALFRGESLKQAMMSFYNAGYKKEEIEEAARALQQRRTSQIQLPPQVLQKPIKTKQKLVKTKQKVSDYGGKPTLEPTNQASPVQPKPVKIVQKVSDYRQPKEKLKGRFLIFLLVSILIILLGILTALFLFREAITEFLNSAF